MKPIGGFFELETRLSPRRTPVAPGALALSTGRACLALLLQHLRPRRVWLPFHCCGIVSQVARRFVPEPIVYAIDERFEIATPIDPAPGDLLIYLNYFGLKGAYARGLAARWQDRLVVDQSQAFFEGPVDGAWSFNSARKFFGVPDGAFCHGPALPETGPIPPADGAIRLGHLLSRLAGRQEKAFGEFQAYEASIPDQILAISRFSREWLSRIDLADAAARRRDNFRFLETALGNRNRAGLTLEGDAVPFAYPLLPPAPLDRGILQRQGIFVPTLWPEVATSRESRFSWERRAARNLLPLPLDHRCDREDLRRVVEVVRHAIETA